MDVSAVSAASRKSFFVDKDGNIVGDPIMGSRNLEDWKTAVEDALEKN